MSRMIDDLRYQLCFANMPNLVYMLDKNTTFLDANDHFLNWIGLKNKPQSGTLSVYNALLESARWTEKQISELKKKDIDAIVSGEASLDETELPSVKNAEPQHFLTSRIPLCDENNAVIGLLVIFKDISGQKIIEEQYAKIKQQLALANAEEAPRIAQSAPISTVTHKLPTERVRVLVVEDNLMAQKAAQAILMQVDCIVELADSQEEVMQEFAPGKYDLILMDIGLEETSGYLLAKHIRQEEKNTSHHTPIVALTGYDAAVLASDCAYYQMEGAMTKPLTLEQARQLIQHYVYHIDLPVTGLQTKTDSINKSI